MIKFHNRDNNLKYSLMIEGYQYPELETGWDGNWLLIYSKVEYQNVNFERSDPCLVTSEVENIINWFRCISSGSVPEHTNLSFTEPNLEFQLYRKRNNLVQYGIKLDLELKPNFKIDDSKNEFVMIFEHSFEELRKIALSFEKQLAKFPKRGNLE